MDSITLEIFRSLYSSVAEEMGVSLRRTAFSPNIKERRDYSCAVFDRRGRLIAQGDHMPVHLGSMPMSVKAALDYCNLQPGDVVILNDPYAGGTHLPDVTMVAPVFESGEWASGRAEESGALLLTPPLSHSRSLRPTFLRCQPRPPRRHRRRDARVRWGQATEIYQEGIRIPPLAHRAWRRA
jgi:N-methylhydantoinase B